MTFQSFGISALIRISSYGSSVRKHILKLSSPCLQLQDSAMSSSSPQKSVAGESFSTPAGHSVTFQELTRLYRTTVRQLPNPGGARFEEMPKDESNPAIGRRSDVIRIASSWKIRDVDQLEMSNYKKYYRFCPKTGTSEAATPLLDASSELASETSDCGQYRASVIKGSPKKGDKGDGKTCIELMTARDEKLIRLDTDKLDTFHGKIYTSGQFGAFQFSPSGTRKVPRLLYVAEKKPSKSEHYFGGIEKSGLVKKETKQDENSKDKKETPPKGDKFLYEQDWGEQLADVKHPVLVVLELLDADKPEFDITVLDFPGRSCGQPVWTDESHIAFVGWEERPRRLGIIYCPIRASDIYLWSVDSPKPSESDDFMDLDQPLEDKLPSGIERLSDGDSSRSAYSPVFNKPKNALVYLENPVGGPHKQAGDLIIFDFKNKTRHTVLKTSQILQNGDQKASRQENDTGLFADGLVRRCVSTTGDLVFFDTSTAIRNELAFVNLADGNLCFIPGPRDCTFVQDVHNDLILVTASSVGQRPNFFIAPIPSSISESESPPLLTWIQVDSSHQDSTPPMSQEIFSLACTNNPSMKIHGILIGRQEDANKAAPTVIIPHGGPHSSLFLSYWLLPSMYVQLGFKVLFINFRGSLGLDQKYVYCLTGHVGDWDVSDCVQIIEHGVDSGKMDPRNLVLYSGSHGGFLITHLTGQRPDLDWAACVARNPVTDLAAMAEATDIPDWTWTEGLGVSESANCYSFRNVVNAEFLSRMFSCSPVAHLDRVVTPTLLMLGSGDKRVPPSQGLNWFHRLRAHSVPTKCLIYDDNHSLQKVDVDSDCFVNGALWILKYLRR